jgi:3-oxoacyl-[acyl-carrier protein] reductase
VVKAIKVAGSEAVLVHANVVSAPDIKKIVAAAKALSLDSRIDILVHNAGHGDDCFLEDITEEFYITQSDINLKGKEVSQDDPSCNT